MAYHSEINYTLRQTLALCLPMVVGLIIGQLHLGPLFSLVSACCNIVGFDTPHKHFFRRLVIGALLFVGYSLIMQLPLTQAIPLSLILTGLTFILGATTELNLLRARLLLASFIAAIFTFSLAGNVSVQESLLVYILGMLQYGLFNWFWFRMWCE